MNLDFQKYVKTVRLINGDSYYESREGFFLLLDDHFEYLKDYDIKDGRNTKAVVVGRTYYYNNIDKIKIDINYYKDKEIGLLKSWHGTFIQLPSRLLDSFPEGWILRPFYMDYINSSKAMWVDDLRYMKKDFRDKITIKRIHGIYKIEWDIGGEMVECTNSVLRDLFSNYSTLNNSQDFSIIIGSKEKGVIERTHCLNNTDIFLLRYKIKEEITPTHPSFHSIPKIPKVYYKNLIPDKKYLYYVIDKKDNYSSISPFIQKKNLKQTILCIKDKYYLASVKLVLLECNIIFNISKIPEPDVCIE